VAFVRAVEVDGEFVAGQNGLVAKRTRNEQQPSIEMVDGLPRYPEDDVEFICRKLTAIEPQSISGFMMSLGIETRSTSPGSSGPSAAYYRIAASFRRGLSTGRLTRSMGQKSWRVAVKAARAS
jgi:hypothetical protein